MYKAVALAVALTASVACSSAWARDKNCRPVSNKEISSLFDRWNNSLQSGDPHKIVTANYAPKSKLKPVAADKPLISQESKEEYFRQFMERKPVAKIEARDIAINCNTAVDKGIYTFTFTDGSVTRENYAYAYEWNAKKMKWLITSHQSSAITDKN